MIGDVPTYGVRQGDVLCLSGGGYRAALFHLGALTRLNELGLLARTGTVGAVSGGSILAALLASRIRWPLHGAFREWPEAVAEPMRAIARRNARARALLRSPIAGSPAEAALEERYARELAGSWEAAGVAQPRFVFGGAGLALGQMMGDVDDGGGIRWEIGDSVSAGYDSALVTELIATVRTDLDAFGEAEQAVLENHGYLLVDAAIRARRTEGAGAIEPLAPEPPHPRWMNEQRVREALAGSARRTRLGRLRPQRVAGSGKGARMAPGAAALLERYRPVVQYDSLESFRADSVTTIVGLAMGERCNSLHRADGTLIASVLPGEVGALLDLDFLGASTYANGEATRPDDYLDESGGSHAADALAMRRRQGCADVVYGRVCLDRDGRLWLQYWFFHYYNDMGMLKVVSHEGDWGTVQLRIGEDGIPDAATYRQSGGGVRLSWDEVERQRVGDEEAPVVYCARGSHACLPRAGTHPAPVAPDHNDGLGPMVRPRLETIGDDGPGWARWPGRWGSTRRREAFEGTSPRGPAQHPEWSSPAEFHLEATPIATAPAWRGGAPPAPWLSALRDGRSATVSYRFPRTTTDTARPERIVAAPYRSEEGEPPRTQTFKIEGEQGSFVLQLPPHAEYAGVRLSAASALGAPGETLVVLFDE